MAGSIGVIAEQLLEEVRNGALTKIAEVEMLKTAEAKGVTRTEVGSALKKLAVALRSKNSHISMDELRTFLNGPVR